MKRQPVIVINGIITLTQTGLAVLGVLGVIHVTKEEMAAMAAFAMAIGNIIGIVLTRNSVTPVSDPRDKQGRALGTV